MTKKKTTKDENLPVPIPPQKRELVLEGDPEAQLAFASKAANALMSVVKKKPKPVIINNKQYLEYGDWQVLARFYGATVEIEWTKPIDENGKVIGYEARALVKRQGEVISSAEGMCMRDEKRWKTADEYAIRSMAQTRTAAKALRNAFGWVAELAGYSATPAEEMPQAPRMASYQVVRTVDAEDDDEQSEPVRHTAQLDSKLRQIKDLLIKLGKKPSSPKADALDVKLLTGKFWKVGKNDEEIIEALRTKVIASDPAEALGEAIKE